MTDWLNFVSLINAGKLAERHHKESLLKPSDNPQEYENFLASTLEYLGKFLLKEQPSAKGGFHNREKSDAKALELRQEGNKSYVKKDSEIVNFERAIELYTKSIAHAIPKSEAMALAFANRSAVLEKLRRPQECIDDIGRALQFNNYPDELKVKLQARKKACLIELDKRNENAKPKDPRAAQKQAFHKMAEEQGIIITNCFAAPDSKTASDRKLEVPKISSKSKKFPCASDALDVEYTELGTKKVVASRDIKVGEVLVVEKPYMTFQRENYFYTHCSYCGLSFFTGIPCDHCVNAIFCSQKCKTSAWKEYHDVECPVIDLLLQDDKIAFSGVRCTRLLIKMAREAGGLNELKERINEFQAYYGKVKFIVCKTENCRRNDNICCFVSDGQLKDEWYQNPSLESILTLKTKVGKLKDIELRETTAIALCVSFHLATATNFLGIQYKRSEMPDDEILLLMSKNANAIFVGGLLVKLAQIVKFNSLDVGVNNYYIFNLSERENVSHFLFQLQVPEKSPGKGLMHYPSTAILPVIGMMNTFCTSNAVVQATKEFVVVHSILPIKKGEEVILSLPFDISWRQMPKNERRAELQRILGEPCTCRACMESWPTFESLKGYKVHF